MDSDSDVANASFDALPEPVWHALFLLLPVDERARAACVCRSWRAFLADPSLWQVLDLTPAGGVAEARVTENLVRGAVARAAGQMRSLSLFDLDDLLLEVIVSDGAELEQIETDVLLSVDNVTAVFAAAPRLQVFNAPLHGRCEELLPVLRNEPPYAAMRMDGIRVVLPGSGADDVLALAAAVAAHEPLKGLRLDNGESARGVNALVDAATERRVDWILLNDCVADAETVPALARLLQRGSLTKLQAFCADFPHAQEESWALLCAALRSCHTLTNLMLWLSSHPGATRRTVAELLDAVAALPALAVLDLGFSDLQDTVAAGRAFGALLRADLPSLRTLRVNNCGLGDQGLAPLLDGLAANTHLRELECEENNASRAFKRNRMAPALLALAVRRRARRVARRRARAALMN